MHLSFHFTKAYKVSPLIAIALVFLIPNFSLAGGCSLQPNSASDLLKPCMDLISELGYNSVQEKDFKNAKCLNQAPTDQEIENWLKTNSGGKKIDGVSHDIQFKNESPAMIDLFDKLTTFEIPGLSKTLYKYRSNCKDVICASKEIFGAKEGPRLLYLLGKYGLNGSAIANGEDASPWNAEELEPILKTLENFPPGLFPLQESKKFMRYKRGPTVASYAKKGMNNRSCLGADSSIQFFDCNFKKEKWDQEYTTFHETSHYIAEELSLEENQAWLKFSSWESKVEPGGRSGQIKTWTAKNPYCFVSEYAKENPYEDMAESMTAYRFNPENLKTNCPAKYQYLRDLVFNGIEYTDVSLCQGKKIPQGMSQNLMRHLKSLNYIF